MRAKTFRVVGSAGGPTFSPVYVVDTYGSPCDIAIGVVVSGNVTVADIQHTFADPFAINLNTLVSGAAWINNATLVSATQANTPNGATDTNYIAPPQGNQIACTCIGIGRNWRGSNRNIRPSRPGVIHD